MLLNVSGIGAKIAAGIIGHMDSASFQQAIHASDIGRLSKLPGIGKKTAERLVIEMRDRLQKTKKTEFSFIAADEAPGLANDATRALTHLGYNSLEADKAVQKILSTHSDETNLGTVITLALRHLHKA